MKIMLDPGHGGNDPGAVGPTGLKEKDVNWKVASMVADMLLRHNINVVLTRSGDERVELADRVKLANDSNADYFISIHCNSARNPSATGTETFAYRKDTKADKLAHTIQRNLVNSISLADRGVKYKDFYVLKHTTMPAASVEIAFINNIKEEALLKQDEFLERAAAGITKGILEHLNIQGNWKKEQGLKHLKNLANKGIIDNPEYWKDKILEPMPIWAVLSLLDRISGGI